MLIWKRVRVFMGATAIGACAFGMAVQAADARTNYAVLTAVTAYPQLPPSAALEGPNHDARLVREYLTSAAPVPFADENVVVLADDLDGAKSSPTHAAILGALGELAGKVQPGDFVYLHFSGHGSRQPAIDPASEPDGLDEIFLPSDTAPWVDQSKGVPNALVDDEIGDALAAIRNAGAFVWLVIDACHSGTATRAAPVGESDVTERQLKPEDLGIPAEAMETAQREAASRSGGSGTRSAGLTVVEEQARTLTTLPDNQTATTGAESIEPGGLVAFFAAQTVETTPEMPLPKGMPDATKYGLFTFTILQKVAENPNITYRQLGQAVLQQYSADSRDRPTPLFEGKLDARVFDSVGDKEVQQWPIKLERGRASIPAGLLHRLSPGTRLAVLADPRDDLSKAIGYVEVENPQNLTSRLVPVEDDGKPALKPSDIPSGAVARVSELAVDFKLRVARPAATGDLDEDVGAVNAMLGELMSDPEKRFNIELVEPGAEADLRLAVLRESDAPNAARDASRQPALWFLPPSGEVNTSFGTRPPLVAIDRTAAGRLKAATAENLTKIYRATALSRLSTASTFKESDAEVEFLILRAGTGEMQPFREAEVPIVNPGDQVHVRALNKSGKNIDLNVLFVGSDSSITHIVAERLVPDAEVNQGLLEVTDSSFGMERMIAVLTEAPPQSETADLRFLEQGGVPPATRSASGETGFAEMLSDIGLAPATRSAMKLTGGGASKGAVMIYPLETRPSE